MASIRSDISTGRRLYIQTAYSEPVVARLKEIGVHWDAEKKCWWISPSKRKEIEEALVASDQAKESGAEPMAAPENIDECRVYAQVEYRGRKYYVIAEQRSKATATEPPIPLRCRLTTLDADAKPFWVDCPGCNLVRTYEGREVWDGRGYSGRTKTVYPTIGSMRAFRDRQRAAEKSGEPVCAGCGKAGGELVEDLEDGCLKHPWCCDIQP